MDDWSEIINWLRMGLIFYIGFVFSLCFAAWAEAFIADKVGDPGPRATGRITLNPLVHGDLMGTVIFPLLMLFLPLGGAGVAIPFLGWCKPVELMGTRRISRRRYELYLSGTTLVAFLFLTFVMGLLTVLAHIEGWSIAEVFLGFAQMNAALFLIHLFPYPASSGSYFLKYLFRMDDETFYGLARWRLLVFILLINIPQCRYWLIWGAFSISSTAVELWLGFFS